MLKDAVEEEVGAVFEPVEAVFVDSLSLVSETAENEKNRVGSDLLR